MTDIQIKRHANGSIDTAHYMALGRQARSDQAYHLARCTRDATQRRVGLLREIVQAFATIRQTARA